MGALKKMWRGKGNTLMLLWNLAHTLLEYSHTQMGTTWLSQRPGQDRMAKIGHKPAHNERMGPKQQHMHTHAKSKLETQLSLIYNKGWYDKRKAT